MDELIEKLENQTGLNSKYAVGITDTTELINKKKEEVSKRLPELDEATSRCMGVFLQYTDVAQLTDKELNLIANSGLEVLEYEGEVPTIVPVLNVEVPSFDIEGIVINQEIDYVELRDKYRKALTVNKSQTSSFQTMFLSNS